MARRGLSERRAAVVGTVVACAVVATQLLVGLAWSAGNDDPTGLELTQRCLEREKGLRVGSAIGDDIAVSAQGGTLRTEIEGGLATISVATSEAEVERLSRAYESSGVDAARLDVHGRYVVLWLREPTLSQRQVTYDCAY